MKRFEDVRNWSALRGIGADESMPLDRRLQSQYQRVMQEVVEIHESMVLEDWDEFQDAIGDTIVTLINLAKIRGDKAEDCLDGAFGVIELRKGITQDAGDFKRYGKLNDEDKEFCDASQGNPGNEYFTRQALGTLTPDNFLK